MLCGGLRGLGQGASDLMGDEPILGIDAPTLARIRLLMRSEVSNGVADGIDRGGQRLVARYGTAIKIQVVATCVAAAAAVAILVVLLAKD